jgi:hypothetical protein
MDLTIIINHPGKFSPRFSIGFKSGENAGQNIVSMLLSSNHSFVETDTCGLALSCLNIGPELVCSIIKGTKQS